MCNKEQGFYMSGDGSVGGKARHTPGPWEATNMEGSIFPSVFIGPHLRYSDNSGNGFRAKITINEGPTPEDVELGRGCGTTLETARANARLIAAAPELLGALELLLSLKIEKDINGKSTYYLSLQPGAWAKARAAIAKASGE